MFRSKYSYQIDSGYLFITDLNGDKSVTNDIEEVLAELTDTLKTSMDNYKILYSDSIGVVDGVKTENGLFKDFVILNAHNFYHGKLLW